MSVKYEARSGTAKRESDFVETAGTLTFAEGTTKLTKKVVVPIIGDEKAEGDETLIVVLSDPVRAAITDGSATGVIIDDEFRETFDTVTPPELPSGWTTVDAGAGSTWATADSPLAHTMPNVASIDPPTASSLHRLISPVLAMSNEKLTFRHTYDTEQHCDGGNLWLSWNGGPFVEFETAGGTFTSGGYSPTPIGCAAGGLQMWHGDSLGTVTVSATLPSAAPGDTMRLGWQFQSDETIASTDWSVDTVIVR